jgi:hypothetical protein
VQKSSRNVDIINLTDAVRKAVGHGVRDAYVFIEQSRLNILLDLTSDHTITYIEDIRKKVRVVMDIFSIAELDLSLLPAKLPHDLAIMGVVRQISPTKADAIGRKLAAKGFIVPSDEWINKKADALRKRRFLVRLRDGRYAVSLFGLKALGTQKGRDSPDISRLLALARSDA